MTLYKHEMKRNMKSYIIWTSCVGLFNFIFILLFVTLKDTMAEMSDSYANMGVYSEALGLNALNLGTMKGFFAVEISTFHILGGAMFAATLGSAIISKEETQHTSEFLTTLPVSRNKILTAKYMTLITNLVLFSVACTILYGIAMLLIGETIEASLFITFMIVQLLFQIEIGSICFMLSSKSKKNLIGVSIGIVLLLYCADLMVHVIDKIEFLKYIEPFYYGNASDIFTKEEANIPITLIGIGVSVIVTVIGYTIYNKKDLAS